MKKNFLILLSLLLTSCEVFQTNYQKDCYKCYFGNEIVLSIIPPFELEDNKKLLQNDISKNNSDYYFSYYILNNNEEVDSFCLKENFKIPDENKNTLILDENEMELVFFFQIPSGYLAYKRNNIQYQIKENEEIFITDNFYTYNSNSNMAFCYVDVEENLYVFKDYIYSFVIKIDKNFASFNDEIDIRGIISDSAYSR